MKRGTTVYLYELVWILPVLAMLLFAFGGSGV